MSGQIALGRRQANIVFSNVLQQPPHHPHPRCRLIGCRRLVCYQPHQELPRRSKKRDHWRYDLYWPILNFHFIHLGVVCPGHILNHILNGWRIEQTTNCCLWLGLLRCTGHDSQRFCYLCWLRQWHRLCAGESPGILETKDDPSHVKHDEC